MKYPEIINVLINEKVLKFGDFTLKSGRKAPYFLNFGEIKSGESLSILASIYAEILYKEIGVENRILFGPAYKGIPLVAATALKLMEKYQVSIPILYNRKEKKDHGEGGILVGKIPQKNDKITIIEDVITAGTAIKESLEIFNSYEDVKVDSVIFALDRMEKGKSEKTTIKELEEEYSIKAFSIANIRDVVDYLYNRDINGEIYIDDTIKSNIENYLNEYAGK